MSKRIYAVSDSHNYLPTIPDDCELLLHAGDFFVGYHGEDRIKAQSKFFNETLYDWAIKLEKRGVRVCSTVGNHDYIFWNDNGYNFVPREFPPNWTWLIDDMVEIDGLKIWGNPWTPIYENWPWMANETELAKKFRLIPEGIDILLSHGPRYGVLDRVTRGHAGSHALGRTIDRVRPRCVISGHLHDNGNEYESYDGIDYYGVSYVDESYFPANEPQRIYL